MSTPKRAEKGPAAIAEITKRQLAQELKLHTKNAEHYEKTGDARLASTKKRIAAIEKQLKP